MHSRHALALIVIVLSTSAWAEPAWITLSDKRETVEIEKQKVELTISPSFRTTELAGGKPELQLRLSVDLADLQTKTSTILERWAKRKSKKCGLTWSFPELAPPVLEQSRLRLAGKLRVQQRACAFGAKTRLWRETARFTLGVRPRAVDNRVRFIAEVENFDLDNGVLAEIGAGTEVRAALQAALQTALAMDDASLGFPKDVAALKPELTGVELAESSNGGAVLVATARAKGDAVTLQALAKLLAGL